MPGRFLILLILLTLVPGFAAAGREDDRMDAEHSTCGLKEPLVFWLWSTLAGRPDASRLAGLHGVEDIVFETSDKRLLRGYRLKATGRSPASGYLLVIQGNAMLADRIIDVFEPFAAAGIDVYIYDFRGYGRSEGKRRLRAMVRDYTEIVAALDSAGYGRQFIYALSFGGILFLDGPARHSRPDRVVIDSTPARLSDHGCPRDYDPVEHLPDDCSNLLLVVGRRDTVVPPAMSAELAERARRCNATVLVDDDFGHPFMDGPAALRRRLGIIEDYLLRGNPP